MSKTTPLVSSNWDRAYKDGKYNQEGPVPFVKDIVNYIKKESLDKSLGFIQDVETVEILFRYFRRVSILRQMMYRKLL